MSEYLGKISMCPSMIVQYSSQQMNKKIYEFENIEETISNWMMMCKYVNRGIQMYTVVLGWRRTLDEQIN